MTDIPQIPNTTKNQSSTVFTTKDDTQSQHRQQDDHHQVSDPTNTEVRFISVGTHLKVDARNAPMTIKPENLILMIATNAL